jgi:hypothetical protein
MQLMRERRKKEKVCDRKREGRRVKERKMETVSM